MKTLRAYKTELKLNNKQRSYFVRCAGTARFVYNWALKDRIKRFENGESTNIFEQKRRFNSLKREEFGWIYEIPYTLQDEAFVNLDNAYKNFFRRVKTGDEKPGFPKFKSRRNGLGSFSLRGHIHIERGQIKLPRIGWVRLKERGYLPADAKILKVTISERARRWFISAQVELNIRDPLPKTGKPLGVDVGVKNLAALSNGKQFPNSAVLRKHERKLACLQRELSRRKKGSRNREKTRRKIAGLYLKISNVRKHNLHQVSAYAMNCRPSEIVIEDLNVKGMMKNRHLAKSIGDASMSELHRQIKYKSTWNGIDVMSADRWFPSSKLCSRCGEIREIDLSQRVYKCESCGFEINRDLNAARNLAALVESPNGRGLPVELAEILSATVKQEAGESL